MLRRFEPLLPTMTWLFLIIVTAKLTALMIDAFLPPVAHLTCQIEVPQATHHYPFTQAFGLKEKQTRTTHTPVIQKPKPPVVSLKGYKLLMTAVGSPSMALINYHGKNHLLSVGELINGFKLINVETDRIQLEKAGAIYWLSMKQDKSKRSSIRVTRKDKRSQPAEVALVEEIRQEGGIYYIPKELVEEMHNIKKIFKYIAINPIYKEHRLKGFAITHIKPDSVFDRMGLRKRDIIEAINGKPLTNEGDAFKYFNQITTLNQLSLTIKRGSERKELHYEIY